MCLFETNEAAAKRYENDHGRHWRARNIRNRQEIDAQPEDPHPLDLPSSPSKAVVCLPCETSSD